MAIDKCTAGYKWLQQLLELRVDELSHCKSEVIDCVHHDTIFFIMVDDNFGISLMENILGYNDWDLRPVVTTGVRLLCKLIQILTLVVERLSQITSSHLIRRYFI